ncbi:hypothetical protein PHLGIDRAFT_44347, partial [Phlebiopsis gigantea 11061_1 CR5-6]
GPVVNLGYAAFAGNTTTPTGEVDGPVTFFGGIPYAQPPIGDLRFRAPQQLDESVQNGGHVPVTDARNWGPPCIPEPTQVGIGSEDCLLLNVWKPTDASEGDRLPVVVYIYNTQAFPLYDWVNQSNPKIVAVSLGYRLNVFGFLSGKELQADGDANAGLLDQRAAIEWVQRHISRFGGDPETITIDGESAGGASVVMQVVAYGGAKPVPFQRAIAQSIGYGPTATAEEAEEMFQNVTKVVGCPSSGSDAMPCMRNASLGAIVSAVNQANLGRVAPVVDGKFLPDLPSVLIEQGKFAAVDFVGGHCTNDGRTFVGGSPSDFVTDDDITTRVSPLSIAAPQSEDLRQRALQVYPAPNATGSPFATQYDRASTMAGDILFTCQDWWLATKLLEKGATNYLFRAQWTYLRPPIRFNAPDPVLLKTTPYEGTMHTSDLYFLMDARSGSPNAGYTFRPFNQTEALLSREAIGFWTSFVSSGDPSAHRLSSSIPWTRFTNSTPARMVLTQNTTTTAGGTASAVELIARDEMERCRFWMALNATAQI